MKHNTFLLKRNFKKKGVCIVALLLLALGLGFIYNFSDKSVVPSNYEPQSISHDQAMQYKAEEQALYDKINYEGTKTYYINPKEIKWQ